MEEHFKSLSAVFPIILRDGDTGKQVLLHKRANTGYMDGMWDFAGSGHVDADETTTQALIRECKEEIGITIPPEELSFAHLSHRVGQSGARTYYVSILSFINSAVSLLSKKRTNVLSCDGLTSIASRMI